MRKLIDAVINNNEEKVNTLLKDPNIVNIKDINGQTALDLAIKKQRLDIREALLNHANINNPVNSLRNPFSMWLEEPAKGDEIRSTFKSPLNP